MLFFYEEEMQNKAEVNLKNKAKQKTNKMNSLVKFELVILGGIPLFLSFCLQQEKHNIYIFHEKGIKGLSLKKQNRLFLKYHDVLSWGTCCRLHQLFGLCVPHLKATAEAFFGQEWLWAPHSFPSQMT